jgi:hypothetical protein
MLEEEIAIVHVSGHQKGRNLETSGNWMANEAPKEANLQVEVTMFNLTPVLPLLPTRPKFSAEEKYNTSH